MFRATDGKASNVPRIRSADCGSHLHCAGVVDEVHHGRHHVLSLLAAVAHAHAHAVAPSLLQQSRNSCADPQEPQHLEPTSDSAASCECCSTHQHLQGCCGWQCGRERHWQVGCCKCAAAKDIDSTRNVSTGSDSFDTNTQCRQGRAMLPSCLGHCRDCFYDAEEFDRTQDAVDIIVVMVQARHLLHHKHQLTCVPASEPSQPAAA